MKRIAFFQSDLGVGGIQKSIVNLLRNLDYSRFQVDLYLSEKTEFWTHDFPKELNIRYLKPIPRIWSFLPFELAKKRVHYDFPAGLSYDLAVDFNSYHVIFQGGHADDTNKTTFRPAADAGAGAEPGAGGAGRAAPGGLPGGRRAHLGRV